MGPAGLEAADPAACRPTPWTTPRSGPSPARRAALLDYGWPERTVDGERTAVVLGNAMSGERHYLTGLRIAYPELAHELDQAPSFQELPSDVRKAISAEFGEQIGRRYPEITEDTMPGELGNCMAGRVANLFDLHGPNFVVDAACASALAAIDASVAGLLDHSYDAAIAGGVDRNMGASSFVKFCKIGALSATGTRPFDAGADGFVMGEGAGVFVLKRLADAERDGDRIYAVIRGIGGASDGRGKGITAPNPVGQRLAVERAWRDAGLSPASCEMIECHGTSTRVGDVVEVTSIGEAFDGAGLEPGSVAIGSAKSNIGHLKAAAGAAGFLKAVMAIHHKELPPSLHVEELNPNIDWAASPFRVNTELRPWETPADGVRTAGVSAFGFGGTNFHVVLEEHVPGAVPTNGQKFVAVGADLPKTAPVAEAPAKPTAPRGALVLGASDEAALVSRLRAVHADAVAGQAPCDAAPAQADLRAAERVAIDYADAAELADKGEQALAAFEQPARWKVLRGRGIFRGSGPAGKVAFLYTGQGSQYANMLAGLRDAEPIVAATFDEADAVMTPLLGRPLTSYLFVDPADPDAVAEAEAELRKTEITQPAVLSVDLAITRLLAAHGIEPDLVMGHSLGEYGALVAAGALTLPAALEAVSARGREMAHLTVEDNGAMAAVFAPLEEIERIVAESDGYVVIANVNSTVTGRRRRGDRRRRGRRRPLRGAWLHDRHAPGQPRLPHLDRGAGERTAAAHARAPRAAAARRSPSSPTSPASCTRWAPMSCPRCSTCWPPRWRRRCGSSTACARCSPRASASSSRSGRRRRCRASPPMSSATMSSRWRRTTPSWAMPPPSTRHSAACTRPVSARWSTRHPRSSTRPPRSTCPSSSPALRSGCPARRTSSTTPTSPASCTASRAST